MADGKFDWDGELTESVPIRNLRIQGDEDTDTPKLPTEGPIGNFVESWVAGTVTDEINMLRNDLKNRKLFDEKAYVKEYLEELQEIINAEPENSGQKIAQRRTFRPSSGAASIAGTIPSTCMNRNDNVFKMFNMDVRNVQRDTLAVYEYKEMILKSLEEHQVLIIEGFTGSGKTTQVPQYILDELCAQEKFGNIVVTQPRRIAAQSVADRVCKERNWNIGELVGYQVGLNRKSTENTRLTYLTTGVLLQTLISKKTLKDYSHIIIDEVHERDLDTDLLILVIKKIMVETRDRQTKIILMSATLNAEKFASYYPRWNYGSYNEESVVIRIPQTQFYEVHEYYLDTLRKLFGDPFYDIPPNLLEEIGEEPKLVSILYDLGVKLISCLDELEERVNIRFRNYEERRRGGVLVFLPGLMEIDTMYKRCMEFWEKNQGESKVDKLKWNPMPLHSSITTEEQQKVFLPSKPGYRKIILATNIAESSITVTDITYVIDFCLTKSISCDPTTNFSCLRMEWASKDQCVQRRGRVGRVSEGYLFRMVPYRFYKRNLRKETVPDMEKACLENVILSVKSLDLGSPKSIMALAIDPPKLSAIKLAICNLKEVGALTINMNRAYDAFDGKLTPMGVLMSKLPFDIHFSRLIALGHIFGVLEESVLIACGLSVKSAFSFPFTRRLMAYMSKLMWANETFSDCFAIINVYRSWVKKAVSGSFRHKEELKAWKRAYFVQTNVLREVNLCIEDVARRLRNINIDVVPSKLNEGKMTSEQGLMLKIVMAGAFYPNYFLRCRPDSKHYARTIVRELNSLDPMMTFSYNGFPQEQPGELYSYYVAQKYETLNSVPYVRVQGSKVLVQFDARGDKVGPLSMNLFRGIKMRMLREQITFPVLRSDISNDISRVAFHNLNSHHRIICPKQIELPSVKESDIKVLVVRCYSPGCFWVIYDREIPRLTKIQTYLADNIDSCNPMRTNEMIPGSLCIVKIEADCFRARVEYTKTDGSEAMLHLIDIGETIWKLPCDCFALSEELLELNVHEIPCLALQCRIYGIKPLAQFSGTWTSEASLFFTRYLQSVQNNITMRLFAVHESILIGDLFEPAGSYGEGGIRSLLLKEHHCNLMEESCLISSNHVIRDNIARGRFPLSDSELNQIDLKQMKHNEPIPILYQPPSHDNSIDCTLKGPFSPLEMSFRAITASTNSKGVTVDGCSVNSVALDQDPSSDTARVLIAGGVAISQRSGSVIARETTLMPPIPGLIGILTMLFCPKMQLRADDGVTYTGCLSGLGRDEKTKAAVYHDHDMEVVFDTEFDKHDIELINGIRLSMNVVLNSIHDYNKAAYVEDCRNSVRGEVARLLERPRPLKEEFYPRDEFIWKGPKDRTIIPGSSSGPFEQVEKTGTFRFRENDVFPLHKYGAVIRDD